MPNSPHTPSSTLSVIILAGGYSRRMGQDKALLALPNGQSLLARTADVAHQLTNDVVVVTPWPEQYRPVLPAHVRLVQEQPLLPSELGSEIPKKPSAGPLSGFAQGWQHVGSEWCLLLACDLPYLQSAPLKAWWEWTVVRSLSTEKGGTDAPGLPAATLIAKELSPPLWEPLCGFYHRRSLPSLMHRVGAIEQASEQVSRSFQSWLKALPILAYPAFPPKLLFNCNTPQDWTQVEALASAEAEADFSANFRTEF